MWWKLIKVDSGKWSVLWLGFLEVNNIRHVQYELLEMVVGLWLCAFNPAGALMSTIYDEKKDKDGFLYVTYSGENTFGV